MKIEVDKQIIFFLIETITKMQLISFNNTENNITSVQEVEEKIYYSQRFSTQLKCHLLIKLDVNSTDIRELREITGHQIEASCL